MTNKEIKAALQIVYVKMCEILELYEQTDAFNTLTEEETETDIDEYIQRKLWDVQKNILYLFHDEQQLYPLLLNILDELETFIKSMEIPGVVPRWRKINPSIEYFDVAFEIIEQSFELKYNIERGLSTSYLSVHPNTNRRKKRKQYFIEKHKLYEENGKQYSEYGIFQDELIKTLFLVFNTDFAYYLIGDDVKI